MAANLVIMCPTRTPQTIAVIPILPGQSAATITAAVDLQGVGEHEIYAVVTGDTGTVISWQRITMQVIVGQVVDTPGAP